MNGNATAGCNDAYMLLEDNLKEYVVILHDRESGGFTNLIRKCEDDVMMCMVWQAYNPVSLEIIWNLSDPFYCREAKKDIVLYQIKRIDSAKEAEVIYDLSEV